MEFLKGVSKEIKKSFLAKLQSGKYVLGTVYDPQPGLTFDKQESGKYKCRQTGELMSQDEIESLQGYRMDIDLVSDRDQVAGNKPPDSIVKMPYTQAEYLDSLLINKSTKVLTWDETIGKFRTETDIYTFNQLMRINHDSPDIKFLMNELTKKKYIECLEKWC